MLSFFPRDVLDEILNLIESVSEGGFLYLLFLNTLLMQMDQSKCELSRQSIIINRSSAATNVTRNIREKGKALYRITVEF